jgi:hypothetical protein
MGSIASDWVGDRSGDACNVQRLSCSPTDSELGLLASNCAGVEPLAAHHCRAAGEMSSDESHSSDGGDCTLYSCHGVAFGADKQARDITYGAN